MWYLGDHPMPLAVKKCEEEESQIIPFMAMILEEETTVTMAITERLKLDFLWSSFQASMEIVILTSI